jgi:predicted Zn-dependent peptidase
LILEKIKENRYWLSNLTRSYTNGNSPEDVLKFEEMVNAVTAKDLQNIAKQYLTKDKVIGMLTEKNNFLVLKLKPAISLK